MIMARFLHIVLFAVLLFVGVSAFGQGFKLHNATTAGFYVSWTVTTTAYDSNGVAQQYPNSSVSNYPLSAGTTVDGYTVDHIYVGSNTLTGTRARLESHGTYTCSIQSGSIDCVWYPYVGNTLTVWIGGTAPCYSNLTYTVQNTTAQSGVFAIWDASGQYQNYINLDPGQSGTLTKNGVPCADIPLYGVIQLQGTYVLGTATGTNGSYDYVASTIPNDYIDYPATLTVGASSGSGAGSGATLGTGGTGSAGGSTATTYDPNSTNSPTILWSNTNSYTTDNSGIISAIKNETTVLFDSSIKEGSQAHNDSLAARALASAQLLTNGINGISAQSGAISAQAGVSVLSNLLSQINGKTGTNGAASTNMTVQNWPAGYSNFLGQISLNTSNLIVYGSNDWLSLQMINSNLALKFGQDSNNAGYLAKIATNGILGTNIASEGTLEGLTNLIGSIDATNHS
jgi:hypothetical protein